MVYDIWLFSTLISRLKLKLSKIKNVHPENDEFIELNKLCVRFYKITSHLKVKVNEDNAVQGGHAHQHDLRFKAYV